MDYYSFLKNQVKIGIAAHFHNFNYANSRTDNSSKK